MIDGAYDTIANRSLTDITDAGQQEVLNWHVLFGAMQHLKRKPSWTTLIEAHIFNSTSLCHLPHKRQVR